MQLATDINVTQKTAWYILHKVRTLFKQDEDVVLECVMECDEMYLGGGVQSTQHLQVSVILQLLLPSHSTSYSVKHNAREKSQCVKRKYSCVSPQIATSATK